MSSSSSFLAATATAAVILLSSSTASVSDAAPVVATWVKTVLPEGAAKPGPREDFLLMNVGPGKLWIHGGISATGGYNDTWRYDVASKTFTEVTSAANTAFQDIPRWGEFGAFMRRNGEYGVMAFHGVKFDMDTLGATTTPVASMSDSMRWFNADLIYSPPQSPWNTIISDSADRISNAGPVARMWARAAMMKSSTNAGDPDTMFMYGGAGSYNGAMNNARDMEELWSFNINSFAWTKLGTYDCTDQQQTCSDTVYSSMSFPHVSQAASLLYASCAASASRPAELTALVTKINTQMNDLTAAMTQDKLTAADVAGKTNTGTCTSKCVNWKATTANRPPPLEGHGLVALDGKVYIFGGYSGLENGQQKASGFDVYHNTMYIYDVGSMSWSSISPPPPEDPQAALWPAQRAHHTFQLHPTKPQIWMVGGLFVDNAGVFIYRNDVNVFDIPSRKWLEVDIRGELPPVSWSASSAFDGNSMFYLGGDGGRTTTSGSGSNVRTSTIIYSDLYELKIDVGVAAANLKVSGDGARASMAGMQSSFIIEARENNNNGTWGDILTYGSALRITATLSSDDFGALVVGIVQDRGYGVYQVSYTLYGGANYQMYVQLNGVDVPNSPFKVTNTPSTVVSASKSKIVTPQSAAPAQMTTIVVQLADIYGTPIASSAKDAKNTTLFLYDAGKTEPYTQIPISSATVNPNGTIAIQYTTPFSTPDTVYNVEVRFGNTRVGSAPVPVRIPVLENISTQLVSAVLVIGALCLLFIVVTSVMLVAYREEAFVRAASYPFLLTLNLGAALVVLSLFIYPFYSTDACRAFPFVFSTGFILVVGSLLVRNRRIAMIFQTRGVTGSLLKNSQLFRTLGLVVAINFVLNILWLIVDAQKWQYKKSLNSDFVYNVCESESGTAWAGVLVVYNGIILLFTTYYATLTRNVPDTFNETRSLLACSYILAVSAAAGMGVAYVAMGNDAFNLAYGVIAFISMWSMMLPVGLVSFKKIIEVHYPSSFASAADLDSKVANQVKLQANYSQSPLSEMPKVNVQTEAQL